MLETAGFLPGFREAEVDWKELTFRHRGECRRVRVPDLDEHQLKRLVDRVKSNRESYLASLPVSAVVDRVDQAAERLLDRKHPLRQKADDWLPVITGLDPDMIRLGLTSALKTFRKPQLLRWLAEDFGNPAILESYQPRVNGGFVRAMPPALLAHVWSGNVPGIPIWSLVSGLLVRSAQIGKVSSAEPLFAGWFVQAVAEVDPRLAQCMAVLGWKGGDEHRERLLFTEAEVVTAYGSNSALESIKSRIPVTTRFLPHGHRIGFGLIGSEALNPHQAPAAARRAARDVAFYDQQGCYSPHCFYVERGGGISPRQFARMLAHELEALDTRFPRRSLTQEEANDWNRWSQKAEWRSLSGEGTEWIGDVSRPWAVVYEEEARPLLPTCLNRSVRVLAVDRLEEVGDLTASSGPYLQTAGIAAGPQRLFQLADRLAEIGVTRICALGHMTAPEAGWHQDGRPGLNDLVRLVDMESSAEEGAEAFAPYSD